ncbi:Cna B-type domain-containing protein [Ruminococcus sp.]|uniref:Cna B-type domain-containing protein n=1 Tax=Ruminococcus sp. TaxID=41978 RepID=UPI0028732035|nr:Cna B-type domain-containing protein [Ruminococcus sp.]
MSRRTARSSGRTIKTTVTNTAAWDVSIYKRWLNFEDGEVPEYVFLMLMSKVQKDYADRMGGDTINIYTPCMSGILGDYKITDLPGLEDATQNVKDGISSTMGDNAVSEIATDEFIELQIKKYLSTGLCLKKVKEKHTNPFLKWSTEFTVKKYGMGDLKLPMDFEGTELVTGLMEMVIDAIIKYYYPESNIHIPVMYQPFDGYWSITGYSLNLFRDYELTSNVINVKFHGSDHGEVVGATKYWKDDKEEDRPESVKIHVYYKDDGSEKEVRGSPVEVKKGDSNGENGWVWALEIPKDSEDYGKDYYIREEVPAGYTAEYCGKNNWDVVNTKSGGTDPTEPTQAPTEAPTESPTSAPTEHPGPTPTEPAGDTGKLQITAARPASAKAKEQSYVYAVSGPDNIGLTVAIVLKAGETNGSVTVARLPAGDYTVTEERAWSWRYSDGASQTATVTVGATADADFDHTLDLLEWLNGCSHRNYQ